MLGAAAELIRWAYDVWPSYGAAIVLASLVVSALLLPLTVIEVRSELARRAFSRSLTQDRQEPIDPELPNISIDIPPSGGILVIYCLRRALLLVAGVVALMVVIGLTNIDPANGGGPRYLDQKTALWLSLKQSGGSMPLSRIDLGKSAFAAVSTQESWIVVGYLVIPIMFVVTYYTKRLRLHGPSGGVRKACLIGASMIALFAPGAVVLYLLTILLFNIGVVTLMIRRQNGGTSVGMTR